MKRISAILCAVSLLITLFAACDNSPAATTQPTTRAEVQTTAPATQTETLPPETTPPETGYQAGGSTTAGGITVHTDPSAYEPYAGSGAKFTRLREGALDHFEPSDDYGEVYPYVAARMFGCDKEGNSWQLGSMYGLVDRNGRILTDGIYTKLTPLNYVDYESPTYENNYQPFWVTMRYGDPVTKQEEYEGETYSWVEAPELCGVISMDGSFALPEEYEYVTPLAEGFCCVREDRSFEVYDGRGELCFTSRQVLDGKEDYWDLQYGDGLYLLSRYFEGSEESQYWFLDRDGNRVLGPYRGANCFHEDRACVSLDGEHYGYIDKSGTMITDGFDSYSYSYRNGRAILRKTDGGSAVIDRDGKVVLEVGSDAWLNLAHCGIEVQQYGGSKVSFYDWDGNELVTGDNYLSCLDADTFYERVGSSTRIFRLNGAELTLAGNYYFSTAVTVLDGESVSGYMGDIYVESKGESEHVFIPGDLSESIPYPREKLSFPGQEYYYFSNIQDQRSGERYWLVWDEDAWIAVSETGNQLRIPLRTANPILRGDRIMAVTDRACVYLDLEGNVVFSYPLNAED